MRGVVAKRLRALARQAAGGPQPERSLVRGPRGGVINEPRSVRGTYLALKRRYTTRGMA